MSKLFRCPCGSKWVVYIGDGGDSLCCELPMMPCYDGQPMPPAGMRLEEALEYIRKEEEDEGKLH
jgi:hypothetical protein